MHSRLILQKKGENKLSTSIASSFERKPKNVYFLIGNLKENGFRIIEEEMIDSKAKIFFAIGVDKKNTTRGMLEDILRYTKNAYYYINNNTVEFDSNVMIFEYEKESVVYVSSSNVSESGINDNISFYTEIIYDTENKSEKDSFKNQIKEIVSSIQKEDFVKLDKENIEKLVEEKEIFTTRQYNHNVKSISELLGKSPEIKSEGKKITKQQIDDVFVEDIQIPKIDLSEISIDLDDIDFSGIEEVKKNDIDDKTYDIEVDYDLENEENKYNEVEESHGGIDKNSDMYDESLEELEFDGNETLDINDMLFKKSDLKLDVESMAKNKKVKNELKENEIGKEESEDVKQTKKVNLDNVSNVIFELPAKATKGNDVNGIKIPASLNKTIPLFFELSDSSKNIQRSDGIYKERKIKLEIIDVKTGAKYTDRDSYISFKINQSYLTFNTEYLKNINYSEKDIARIIKLSDDVYHIEIIPQDMQEYKLWSKLCTQNFKSSTRKFGIM